MDVKPPVPDANLEYVMKGVVALGLTLWAAVLAMGRWILGSFEKRLKAVEDQQKEVATKDDLAAASDDIKDDIRELRRALFHSPGE